MEDSLTSTRRVFLSQTSELADHPAGRSFVAAAKEAVTRAGDVVVEMSSFPASNRVPAAFCTERVSRCNVLVVIAGFRYGSPVADRPDLSHVELEYDVAGEVGLPRLAFLLDENAHGPATLFLDPEGGARQHAFRKRLRSGLIRTFASPEQLETEVLHALVVLECDRTVGGDRSSPVRISVRDSTGTQVGDHNIQMNDFDDRHGFDDGHGHAGDRWFRRARRR